MISGEVRSEEGAPAPIAVDLSAGTVTQVGIPRLSHDAAGRMLRWDDKGARKRGEFDIRAYVGLNGSGKTLAMVHDVVPSLRAGRKVLSTVRIIDPATGEDHPQYEKLTDWKQLLEAEGCAALFDEVQGIANSRSAQGMPVQVQTFLHQLRRRDISLSWTSPSWSRADLLLREVTRSVTVCRGYFPEVRKVDGEAVKRAWGANRLFRWITYDAADFTAWTDSAEGKLKGKQNAWLYRPAPRFLGMRLGRPALAQEIYDTLDSVSRIGEVLDSGRCADCGGTRRPDPCSCAAHVNRNKTRVAITDKPAE